MSNEKIRLGQFYTAANLLDLAPFRAWLARSGTDHRLLEPFAGAADLLEPLTAPASPLVSKNGLRSWEAYDIAPRAPFIQRRDTLESSFWTGVRERPDRPTLIITNPPYLSRRRARSLGAPMTSSRETDLWQIAANHILASVPWAAIILPERAWRKLRSERRLSDVVLLGQACADTEQPVALFLFQSAAADAAPAVWDGSDYLGTLAALDATDFLASADSVACRIEFNAPSGQVGLLAADSRTGTDAAFVFALEVATHEIKASSRHRTRFAVPSELIDGVDVASVIREANAILREVRRRSFDLALTPMHGLRRDGRPRRRLPYRLAARIIAAAISSLQAQGSGARSAEGQVDDPKDPLVP